MAYPIDFQAKPSLRIDHGLFKSVTPGSGSAAETILIQCDVKRSTADDLAEATRRCQVRIQSAREKDAQARRLQWQQEQEKQVRSELAGHAAPGLAAKRLRDRKLKERQLQEESINLLITQQPSSIETMDIARMLSPRFEERVVFTPSVSKNSVEEDRIKQLLGSARVGSYYQ
ncbi:hypothetical protein FI667_g11627, partial [Globisporangium splendens]